MDDEYTRLDKGGIQQRLQCKAQLATQIKRTFVTVEQLVDSIKSPDPLTARDGIGPKTAEKIMEWWQNREEREGHARRSTVTRTGSRTASIAFHPSWADAIGLDEEEEDDIDD